MGGERGSMGRGRVFKIYQLPCHPVLEHHFAAVIVPELSPWVPWRRRRIDSVGSSNITDNVRAGRVHKLYRVLLRGPAARRSKACTVVWDGVKVWTPRSTEAHTEPLLASLGSSGGWGTVSSNCH